MAIGELLRHKRLDAGTKQAAVAKRFGVSQASYSAWERDESIPKSKYIPSIAEYLGMSLPDLMLVMLGQPDHDERMDRFEELLEGLTARVARLEGHPSNGAGAKRQTRPRVAS